MRPGNNDVLFVHVIMSGGTFYYTYITVLNWPVDITHRRRSAPGQKVRQIKRILVNCHMLDSSSVTVSKICFNIKYVDIGIHWKGNISVFQFSRKN